MVMEESTGREGMGVYRQWTECRFEHAGHVNRPTEKRSGEELKW